MKKLIPTLRFALSTLIATLAVAGIAYAGSLTPPAGTPAATAYTLGDIFTRLTTNGTAGSHTVSTTTAPAPSFYTLTQIYDAIPTIDATKVLTGTTYLGVQGSASAGDLLKTRQTLCYDPSGSTTATIPCAGSGQDGEYQSGVAISYTDNSDGTITDNSTGLMWVKDPSQIPGGTWGAPGSPSPKSFANAITSCEALSYAGHTDWRLPNIKQLASIDNFNDGMPSINEVFFPNTKNDIYWSSTTYVLEPDGEDDAWIVDFSDAGIYRLPKITPVYVRCVRE